LAKYNFYLDDVLGKKDYDNLIFPIPMKKRAIEIFSLYGLSSSLVFGLALEVAQLTVEDNINAQGFQMLRHQNLPFPTGVGALDREDWDTNGNNILCTSCVTDAAVDIFTRYISTPALGELTHLDLVDTNDANNNNTIDPLVQRLRNFYATDLEVCQAVLRGQRLDVPNHLSIAAVTIVSYVGQNQTLTCPNGECFQFSTYFLDHLFVSGDAAHNNPLTPVPPYHSHAFAAFEDHCFDFFGKFFPAITLPSVLLPGSYGDPTGPSIACDEQGGLQFPNGAMAAIVGDMFAFPHAPITAAAGAGANGLTPLNANVVAWYNATWPAVPPRFAAGTPHSFGPRSGVDTGDLWFSGWWYSSGQLQPALCRHSERALGVFLESIYSNGLVGLPAPGGGVPLPPAPALPAAYGVGILANHPDIQPDAVEICNAIQSIRPQNNQSVVAVIVHIKNILRMCSQCAACLRNFTQLYLVANGNGAVLGDGSAGQVRFVFVVGSGRGGAIEIYQ
jgi:hypothetical protein